jgi:hypothetical protein
MMMRHGEFQVKMGMDLGEVNITGICLAHMVVSQGRKHKKPPGFGFKGKLSNLL